MRAMVAVGLVVLPGAFLAVLGYLAFRTVRRAWLDARSRIAHDQQVAVKDVLSGVNVRSLVREARAVAF
ncbi:MAG: hypothetical protein M3Y59_14360 [Myxococcota bacterium]|nr:hypothetical protein [Myxococcota bacterium]